MKFEEGWQEAQQQRELEKWELEVPQLLLPKEQRTKEKQEVMVAKLQVVMRQKRPQANEALLEQRFHCC